MANRDAPIGVFDSGVGGLTVARAIMRRLPQESIVYFGDTARVPYGIKSVETIAQYAREITTFLLQKEVKLLVVACNTMAAVATQVIGDLATVPVLDVIEAGARAALNATRGGRIGVIGTLTTVNSGAYERALGTRGSVRVYAQACPLFVPLVEEGWLTHEVTRLTAREYLAPLLAERIDTLVLGCTHYPLLKPVLQETMGTQVALVDAAETIADETAALMNQLDLACATGAPPRHEYYVTDVPLRFQAIGERFLGHPIAPVQVVKW